MTGMDPDEALKAQLAAEFPGWDVWEHVGRSGLWYARRPRCSPPMVTRPVPLASLGDAIRAVIERRRELAARLAAERIGVSGPGTGESVMSDVMKLLTRACRDTPDWYHVSRQHWVMNLDWYKQIRRDTAWRNSDAEQDEDKWIPAPGDQILGYPVEVREDGGEPHLVPDAK